MPKTISRKLEHLRICLEENVEIGGSTGFEDVILTHTAIPELDFEEINIETKFITGAKISAPIMIEGMTGGHKDTLKINSNLAEAAEKANIPIEVGSQRAGLEESTVIETYRIVREKAPSVPVIANIGITTLLEGNPVQKAIEIIDMINANAIAIHLNPLQELLQPEGSKNFKGSLLAIKEVCNAVTIPVIVKEVGTGISGKVASLLERAGVDAIDVAGKGGTNWAYIEGLRRKKPTLSSAFISWGIPTALAVIESAKAVKVPIIASGGIRSGVDTAKAINLGAEYTGMALPYLRRALESVDAVLDLIREHILELKIAMFLTGSRNIRELKKAERRIIGRLRELLSSPP